MVKLSVNEIKRKKNKLFVFLSDNLEEVNYSVMFYDRIFFRNSLHKLNNMIIAFPDKMGFTKEEQLKWEAIFNDGIIESKKYKNLKSLGKRVNEFWNDYNESIIKGR